MVLLNGDNSLHIYFLCQSLTTTQPFNDELAILSWEMILNSKMLLQRSL